MCDAKTLRRDGVYINRSFRCIQSAFFCCGHSECRLSVCLSYFLSNCVLNDWDLYYRRFASRNALTLKRGDFKPKHFTRQGQLSDIARSLIINHLFTHLLTSLYSVVKELWKSVKFWQSYCDESGVFLFGDTVYVFVSENWKPLWRCNKMLCYCSVNVAHLGLSPVPSQGHRKFPFWRSKSPH